jgi:hypothetical protein
VLPIRIENDSVPVKAVLASFAVTTDSVFEAGVEVDSEQALMRPVSTTLVIIIRVSFKGLSGLYEDCRSPRLFTNLN